MKDKSILGFALIGIVLLLFSWYNSRQYDKQAQLKQQADSAAMEIILIIVVQLLVVLIVIRPFFPNALGKYKTMDEKADRVIENLTNK